VVRKAFRPLDEVTGNSASLPCRAVDALVLVRTVKEPNTSSGEVQAWLAKVRIN
jgi:hypothetical protein